MFDDDIIIGILLKRGYTQSDIDERYSYKNIKIMISYICISNLDKIMRSFCVITFNEYNYEKALRRELKIDNILS